MWVKAILFLAGLGAALLCSAGAQVYGPVGPYGLRAEIDLHGDYGNQRRLMCSVSVRGDTNLMFFQPVASQRYDIKLIGPDGELVEKTRQGRAFGWPPEPDAELLHPSTQSGYRPESRNERALNLHWDPGSNLGSFPVLECFCIKKPGHCRLRVEVRLFVQDARGVYQPVSLPVAEIPVDLSADDLPAPKPWGTRLEYGLGLMLCAAGTGWLLARRRAARRKPAAA